MPRISSKLPITHPAYVAPLTVTNTSIHYVSSLASGGTNASQLMIPATTVDADGKRFNIFLSGRIKLYSSASPGTFNLRLAWGTSYNAVGNWALNLPPSAAGTILPFSLRAECNYDSVAQLLFGYVTGILGNQAYTTYITPQGATNSFIASPSADQLIFSCFYSFQVAPNSGTTVEITEFSL